MYGADDSEGVLDARLGAAEVLRHEYDDCDPVAARERVARMLGGPLPTTGHPPLPAPYPAEHEQARHELDLASALVINSPHAAACLARLADDHRIDPDGALVFACLLHITGRDEAAQFWWQFAAGGGSHTAAYCLYLHHRRHAEFRDADYWRAQAAELAARPPGREAGQPPAEAPLLPPEVRRALIAQCYHGRAPHLPPAIESLVNRLQVAADDEDFGEIPLPSRHLTSRLIHRSG